MGFKTRSTAEGEPIRGPLVGKPRADRDLLPFCDADLRWGFVDSTGQIAIEPRFDDARFFSGGLAPIKVRGRWGFVDGAGNAVIETRFSTARPFSGGAAVVSNVVGDRTEYFHIDREGRRLSQVPSINAGNFNDGLGRIMDREGRWLFLNSHGEVALGPRAGWFGDFSGGRACFSEDGRFFGYMDREGRTVIEPRYERASEFREGLAAVSGFSRTLVVIDADGNQRFETPEAVNDFGVFTGGLLRVQLDRDTDHRYGWIDADGHQAIEPRFSLADDFEPSGYAMAAQRRIRRGLIDRTGAWALEPEFYGVPRVLAGCAMVFPSRERPNAFGWLRIEDHRWLVAPPGGR